MTTVSGAIPQAGPTQLPPPHIGPTRTGGLVRKKISHQYCGSCSRTRCVILSVSIAQFRGGGQRSRFIPQNPVGDASGNPLGHEWPPIRDPRSNIMHHFLLQFSVICVRHVAHGWLVRAGVIRPPALEKMRCVDREATEATGERLSQLPRICGFFYISNLSDDQTDASI